MPRITYQLEDRLCALATFALNNWKDQSLIVGSSATPHMTNDVVNFSYIKPYQWNNVIYVGAGNWTLMIHTGDAYFMTLERKLNLKDVLVVPNLKKNLLFIGMFTSNNHCYFEFTLFGLIVKNQNQRTIVRGNKRGSFTH